MMSSNATAVDDGCDLLLSGEDRDEEAVGDSEPPGHSHEIAGKQGVTH